MTQNHGIMCDDDDHDDDDEDDTLSSSVDFTRLNERKILTRGKICYFYLLHR